MLDEGRAPDTLPEGCPTTDETVGSGVGCAAGACRHWREPEIDEICLTPERIMQVARKARHIYVRSDANCETVAVSKQALKEFVGNASRTVLIVGTVYEWTHSRQVALFVGAASESEKQLAAALRFIS